MAEVDEETQQKDPLLKTEESAAQLQIPLDDGDDEAEQKKQSIWSLAAELIVTTLFVFYIDLGFDLSALKGFVSMTYNDKWQPQWWFFGINFGAIVFSWLLTFYELLHMGKTYSLTQVESLILGMSFPFQLHIAVLVFVSIKYRRIHPLLVLSKFAEAGIEAVISALIQLYSVIFCNSALDFANCDFDPDQRHTMLLSVLSSVVSIAVAFTMFDLREYGASGFPGSIPSKLRPKYFVVLTFRAAEVTSRLLCLSLFQFVTRPNGIFVLFGVDGLVLVALTLLNKGALSFVVPNWFCLVNPLLEEYNVLSIPHWQYYTLRAIELVVMFGVMLNYNHKNLQYMHDIRELKLLSYVAIAASATWMLLLPLIRFSMKVTTMKERTYEWTKERPSDIQLGVRNLMLRQEPSLCAAWLAIFRKSLTKMLSAIEQDSQKHKKGVLRHVSSNMGQEHDPSGEAQVAIADTRPFADKVDELVHEVLMAAYHTPLHFPYPLIDGFDKPAQFEVSVRGVDEENRCKGLLDEYSRTYAQEVRAKYPKYTSCCSNLESAMWSVLFVATNMAPLAANAVAQHPVGPQLLALYVRNVLQRYTDACKKGNINEFDNAIIKPDEEQGQIEVKDDAGHIYVDVEAAYGKRALRQVSCDTCQKKTPKMYRCNECEICVCDECYNTRYQQLLAEEGSSRDNSLSDEEQELRQVIMYLNTLFQIVGQIGTVRFGGDEKTGRGPVLLVVMQHLIEHGPAVDKEKIDEVTLRKDPVTRAGLELMVPLAFGKKVPGLTLMPNKTQVELFKHLLSLEAKALSYAFAWFPAAIDAPTEQHRRKALKTLAKYFEKAMETAANEVDDTIVLLKLVEYVTSIGADKRSLGDNLVAQLQNIAVKAKKSSHKIVTQTGEKLQTLLEASPNKVPSQQEEITLRRLVGELQQVCAQNSISGKVTASGQTCQCSKAESREKRNETHKNNEKDVRSLLEISSRFLHQQNRAKQPGFDMLAAIIIGNIVSWCGVEHFVKRISDGGDLKQFLETILQDATQIGLNSDWVGCEAILKQVVSLLNTMWAAFYKPVNYGQCDESHELKRDKGAFRSCDVCHKNISQDAIRYSCKLCGYDKCQACLDKGSDGKESCEATCSGEKRCSQKSKEQDVDNRVAVWKPLLGKLNTIIETKKADDTRPSVINLSLMCSTVQPLCAEPIDKATVETALSNLIMEDKEDKDKEEIDTTFDLKKVGLVWSFVGDADVSNEGQPSLVQPLFTFLQKHEKYPSWKPSPNAPTLLERMLPILPAAPISPEVPYAQTLIQLMAPIQEDSPAHKYKLRLMKKMAPIGSKFENAAQMPFTLVHDWAGPAKKKVGDVVSFEEVLNLRKPVVCFLYTSW